MFSYYLQISVFVLAAIASTASAGGPRRRGSQRLSPQNIAAAIAGPDYSGVSLDPRTGRNLAGVFPFAGGARGEARSAQEFTTTTSGKSDGAP